MFNVQRKVRLHFAKKMRPESLTPTMKDVAQDAGVSLGTVSKVVNGIPVGESYRIKVEESIKKLNYRVNSYAQGMKSQKTNTVAVLIPTTIPPFYADLIYHINSTLLHQNYKMLLCCTDANPQLEQDYVNMALQNQVDGIIALTYRTGLVIDEKTPFVSIDRSIGSHIPCVASDNFAGGQLAAEKLADLGCKRVAFLRTGSILSNEPNKRKAGFENGCLLRGLEYDMKILNDGDPHEEFMEFLKEHLHEGRLDFDGLFCVTDEIAFEVQAQLSALGLRVPEDVQLIGFDGIRHFGVGNYICSTIVQPAKEIAEMAVKLLLEDDITSKPPLVCLPVSYAYGGTTNA